MTFKMKSTIYVSPEISTLTVEVEAGFAASGVTPQNGSTQIEGLGNGGNFNPWD